MSVGDFMNFVIILFTLVFSLPTLAANYRLDCSHANQNPDIVLTSDDQKVELSYGGYVKLASRASLNQLVGQPLSIRARGPQSVITEYAGLARIIRTFEFELETRGRRQMKVLVELNLPVFSNAQTTFAAALQRQRFVLCDLTW